MIELFKNPNYDFIGKRKWAYIVSIVLTLLGLTSLAVKGGLRYDLDFTGGTLIQVRFEKAPTVGKIRAALGTIGLGESIIQQFGDANEFIIRLPLTAMASEEISKRVQGALSTEPDLGKFEIRRVEFVGPQVGRELAEDGAKALAFVVLGIMVYLAFRFEWKFSIAAIVANLHDVVIILGFFAFFQWEFSLSVLAAVLAVLGYSVNESVVIFDRIRESFRRYRKMTTMEVIDHAITSTISRTIITHGSTQMMVLSMLVFGGQTLHYFAIALTIGILFGIYSSVFVAAAIAMWLGVKREDLVKSAAKDHDPNDPNAGAVV